MCQALVLKYSNAEPEQLLGVIPLEEVAELMRMRILVKVRAEVESEYQGRIDDAVGDASEWEDRANEAEDEADIWKCRAVELYRAMERAASLPEPYAMQILKHCMEKNKKHID